MKRIAAVLLLVLLAAWAVPARGQEPSGPDSGKAAPKAEEGGFEKQPAFGREPEAGATARRAPAELPVGGFLFWTAVVLLALVGALSVLRRVAGSRRLAGASDSIRIVGRRALGPHQHLVLVEVGTRILRVGLTKDSMVYLGETVDPEEVAAIKAQGHAAREDSSKSEFERALQSAASGTDPAAPAEAEPGRFGEVKRELAAIRKAVQGWMG